MPVTAPARPQGLFHLARVRVSAVLAADVELLRTTDGSAMLVAKLQPATGLPYVARVPLGPDVTDQMLAQAELPGLRAGTFVSVGGDALQLRTDHGHAALQVMNARDLVAFYPDNPTAQEG